MLPDFPNSAELLAATSIGDMVLFLGAGVNADCEMGDPPKPAPLGNNLSQDLSKHFFPDEAYNNESLKAVSTKIQNIEGNEKLRSYLINRLHPVRATKTLMQIPYIQWNSIYTVNIDYGIETAYSNAEQKVQKLVPIVLPTDPSTSDAETELPYIKLHGCLMKPESNIIFSHRDYTQAREQNLRLFANLTTKLCEHSFLFIGFGFEDSDFHDLWESVKKYGGSLSILKPTFLIKPSASPSFIKSMEIEGVTVIDSDAKTFLPWLRANLARTPNSIEDKIIDRSAPITNWAKRKLSISISPNLADSIRKYCQIVSELEPPVRLPEKSNYLIGASPYWDDIQNNLPIKREIENEIIDDISNWLTSKKPRISLLLGAAGYGKSTLLMQTAYDICKNDDHIILWVRQNVNFDPTPISEFCKLIKKPILIMFDDGPKYMSSIKRLYLDAVNNKFQLYILIGARQSEWNSARGTGSIPIPSKFTLQRLSEKEALNLANLLLRSGLLEETGAKLSAKEISNQLIEVGEKHIIAGLRTVITGKETKFHEIIADEYFRIKSEDARNVYLSVALSHSLAISMPAALATKLVKIPLIEYHIKMSGKLEEIVLEEIDDISGELLFSTQHRVIAEALLESVIDPASISELLINISKNINPHSYNEYELLKRVYQEDYLAKTLKESGRIRSLYTYLMAEFPSDPYIKQHAAIFESQEKNFETARDLADDAINLSDRHPHFLNTKGTIWLREAISEPKPDRAEYALKKGAELIRERISKDTDKEIHYHSLIDKMLDWALTKGHLPEKQRLRVIEEAQEDLDNALRLYPMSSELIVLLGRLNIALDKIPEAEEKLKRSILLDAGNVRAILLLANLLIKRKKYLDALKYINDGIPYAPKSSGIHRLKIKCLIAINGSWGDIKNSYKDYFKIVPNDYRRKIRYIKELIQHKEFGEAPREIRKISDSPISFSEKLNLKIILLDHDQKPMVVNGTYKPYRLGKGFVEIEGFPRNLNAHMDLRTISSGDYPQSGQSMKVEISLNGLGVYVNRVIT